MGIGFGFALECLMELSYGEPFPGNPRHPKAFSEAEEAAVEHPQALVVPHLTDSECCEQCP